MSIISSFICLAIVPSISYSVLCFPSVPYRDAWFFGKGKTRKTFALRSSVTSTQYK
ncbi:hypothetical protein V6N12_013021 [Hibiscus sabdariffa]|uniref:Secreted protein n=1 Tax=Hibiscus sabdariffa TaxID=183260 RepID=A0ABR2EGJ0_9ROSI